MRGAADDAAMSVSISGSVVDGRTIIGWIVGTRHDLADVFALHVAGRAGDHRGREPDEVDESLDDVLSGRIPARVVFGVTSPAASPDDVGRVSAAGAVAR